MSIIIDVKVFPRARKQLLKLDPLYDLRCYVTSPPEDNKANFEVIAFLASCLGVSKSSVTLLAGFTSRIKRLEVAGFKTKEEMFNYLRLEVQSALF